MRQALIQQRAQVLALHLVQLFQQQLALAAHGRERGHATFACQPQHDTRLQGRQLHGHASTPTSRQACSTALASALPAP